MKPYLGWIVPIVPISIFLINITPSGLWYPDAPSHALNGAFWMDMIAEGGFLKPVSYAERYYVQYPSLTIGLYPPVFYVVEALFYAAFGVSSLAAKMAVLAFTLLGVSMFFRLCRLWFSEALCAVASLLYVLQPMTLFGQKNVMLEMPALAMSITALYFLYIATDTARPHALFLAPVVTSLAILTKQNAAFLLLLWLFWVIRKRKWALLKNVHFICGALFGAAVLAPWMLLNVTVGRSYMAVQLLHERHFWDNCVFYLKHFGDIVSPVVILLSLLGVILFPWLRKYDHYIFGLLWTISSLCYLLPLGYAEPRFAMFVTPPLIIVSSGVLWFLHGRLGFFLGHRYARAVVLSSLLFLNMAGQNVWGSTDIRGFERAAHFVLEDSNCVSVLYDGYFNSNFVFNMRASDQERKVFVFRASKVVYSNKLGIDVQVTEIVKEQGEFEELLKEYSIKYIVQETEDLLRTKGNERLREWVQGEKFKPVRTFPLCCVGLGQCGDLKVFQYLDYQEKPIGQIVLDMPSLGREIVVDIGGTE